MLYTYYVLINLHLFQLINYYDFCLPSAEGMTANSTTVCQQTSIHNVLHTRKAMNMLACHCTDLREVITYILLADDTNTLNTWWDLVRVFSTWYYATINVPYKPIIW